MSYRPSTSIHGLLVAMTAAVPFLGGCPSDPAKSSCVIETHEVTVPNKVAPATTSLLLLPDARLDASGDGFVLLGTDGANVRWAVLGKDGVVVGDEQLVPVPTHAGTPLFAAAGTTNARDHIVVAYLSPPTPLPSGTPAPTDVDLMTFSVQIDGTSPTVPASSGKIPVGATVTMMSGRGGMQAGVAWVKAGTSVVSARILGGDGVPVGPDLAIGSVENSRGLRFSPGKADLTLGYVDQPGTPPMTSFVGTELDTSGGMKQFRLNIGEQATADPDWVELVPTDKGYGVSWHSQGVGIIFSAYDPTMNQLPSKNISPDVEARPLPILAGLGWLGKTYAVVLTQGASAEIRPIDAMGQSQGVLPALPSVAGHIGQLSTQPIGSALYLTYADYVSATAGSAGSRLLVKVSCP